MTIEQKAKRYDEAIKEASIAYKDEDRHLKAALERIFHELKESEDEKIRKYLIERIISAYGENSSTPEGIKVKNIINWLEKRKRLYSDYEESELRRGLLWHLKELQNIEKSKGLPIKAKATYESWITWLEKQGEQKPYDQRKECKDCQFNYASECKGYCALKRDEQKPADWSEEDETRLTNIIIMLKEGASHHFIKDDITKAVDWLKSLKPQNKCVYNPYKEVVESIAEMCKHYDKASHSGLRDFYDNVKVKCKDATEYDHLFPQNHWKPTDEQMIALRQAISGCSYDIEPLLEIEEQLKQL